nr:hypothetical protein [Tanacetum cinerariifolium]
MKSEKGLVNRSDMLGLTRGSVLLAFLTSNTVDELSDKELKQIEADDQAIQTILLGLPEDIYAAVDSCETAQEIWLRVQQMIKGYGIGIQEKKAKLFNEWERFTSNEGESIESYYHRFLKLMNDLKRNKHFPEKIASNLKFLNNLQPEWSRHVIIVHQTKDLHTADYTQLYDFLKYNQKEVDELKAERLAKTEDPLALMANSNNPYTFPAPHQDQSSFNQNYLQQRIGFHQTHVTGRLLNLVAQNPRVQNVGNQNGLIGVQGNGNQNQIENGNLVAVRAKGNAAGQNENQIRCYNCRGKEEAGIQLQAEEYDLMAAEANPDEIEEVNANCILMANLQQASTSAEQYTELLEPIPESHQVPHNDNNVISADTSVEQGGETVEHPANFEETRALYESLYHNLAIEVEKVNSVNRKLKETNADMTTELARYKNQERSNTKNDRVPSASKSSQSKNKEAKVEEHHRNLLLSKNNEHMSSACCSNHMTGNLKLLINFVWKFMGTICFGNDHVAAILGFGDLQNLEGVDLLKGDRSTNLYTINLHAMASALPICLMARASSTKSWLWHQRLSHLNFDTINDLARNDLVAGLLKFKYHKEHLCPSCEQGKSKQASHPPKPVPNSRQRLHLFHMDLISPDKVSREAKKVPNTVSASSRTKPIAVSQPSVITKKNVNSDLNGLSSTGLDNTKTRRSQPRSNTKNDRVPSASESIRSKNKDVKVEEHHRNLLIFKNIKHISSACNNSKIDSQDVISKVVCAMCKKCLNSVNHDVCLNNYVNGKKSHGRKHKANVSKNEMQ